MGCQTCKKEIQVPKTEIPLTEKKKTEEDILKFEPEKARKLIKFMLSEDPLYHNSLNPILLFNDEQLENLFNGNNEYKNYPYHNIQNQKEFEFLLMKFEDHSNLLYEWYKDESKYDNLIKLWKRNLSIYPMKEYSDERLEEEFKNAGITDIDEFIIEFRTITNNSLETKASNIANYLKYEYEDFYSVITTCEDFKNDSYLSKPENKDIFKKNFENIMKKLVSASLPLIKSYIKNKYLNLNNLSKIQLKSNMLNKLRDKILTSMVKNKPPSNSIGFDNVLSLVNKIKNGKAIPELMNQVKSYYNCPQAAVTYLATSFMNLCVSIKTYYNNSVEFDQKTKHFSDRMDSINRDFEFHKKQIGLLDLDNYEEALEKVKIIGRKIREDREKIVEFVKNIDNEEKSLGEEKKKQGVAKVVASGAGIAVGVVGTILTGGALALVWGAGAVASGIATGVNIANLVKIKKQLGIYRDYKEREIKKYDEIENTLADLELKYKKLNERYIPRNLIDS